jgi:hypothetical protein
LQIYSAYPYFSWLEELDRFGSRTFQNLKRKYCRRRTLLRARKEDIAMKKFLLIAAASLTLSATVPASAQVYFGAGPGGVGVGVGDPDYGWRHRHWRDSYAFDRDDCRVIRERVVTPSGRVIYRSRHICD